MVLVVARIVQADGEGGLQRGLYRIAKALIAPVVRLRGRGASRPMRQRHADGGEQKRQNAE